MLRWEQTYGKSAFGPFNYHPSNVSTTCARCHKSAPHMSRHHIANDFFFALWFPDMYAPRYIQFHTDDCVKLCEKCHKNVHKYLKPIVEEMYAAFEVFRSQYSVWKFDQAESMRQFDRVKNGEPAGFNCDRLQTADWVEPWKKRLKEATLKWLKSPYRGKNKRRRENRKSRLKAKRQEKK